jgi:glutathione peroxidase-family protein
VSNTLPFFLLNYPLNEFSEAENIYDTEILLKFVRIKYRVEIKTDKYVAI